MFARAIELDAGYALAHAGLADCCTFLFMHVMGRDEMREMAIEAGRRAVELDPELAQAHVSLGLALSLTRDHDAAEREFERALDLDSRLFEAHYFYARDAFMQGKLEKAVQHYERAHELRPEDYQAPLLVGQIYEDLKQPDMAETARRRGLRAAETRLALHPDDVRALYMGANALVALGERERGLEWAQRAFALDPEDAMLLYNLACIFSMAGRREEALDFLQRSVQAGMNRISWLKNDSNLDPIRDDERFRAAVRRFESSAPPA
jgi:adenylate cyclase